MTTDPYGCYRVIDPPGALPQNCWKLDNDPRPRDGETALEVEVLNVDSSSFRQLTEESESSGRPIEELILDIVNQRGKLHNPVTGSGGMLLGVTPEGERVASLVSLTLTPLQIESVRHIDPRSCQIHIRGKAILFAKTLYCPMPEDLAENVALAALDVAGAPARCARLCRGAARVLLLGAGKAGLLVAEAVRRESPETRIIALDKEPERLRGLESMGLCDWAAALDAESPLEVLRVVEDATAGQLADLTVSLVNQPDCEGSAILATREGGRVYFFSLATSFSKAALSAEGLAKDVEMMIGSGYTRGGAEYALGLLRANPRLRNFFEQAYG